jgi:hypothetical protein
MTVARRGVVLVGTTILLVIGGCTGGSSPVIRTSEVTTTVVTATTVTTTSTATAATSAPPPEPVPTTTPAASATIPTPFVGRYAGTAAACGSPDELQLTLAADRVDFWESSGVVTVAAVDGDVLSVTGSFTGEGETRSATYRFRLSADGATLTDVDHGAVRVRCP